MDYETLSEADQLALAKDTLRGKESDHFRVSLLEEPAKEQRLEQYETEIENLKKVVDELQANVDAANEPAPKKRTTKKAS